MRKRDGLRAFAFVVWGLCYVSAIFLAVVDIEFSTTFTGTMHPSFLVLSYGMSVAFLAIHFLVFSGSAGKIDLSFLALYFTLYVLTAFAFIPNPAYWIRFFAISIIVLGVEYAFPDWPVRIYRALTGAKSEGSRMA